jgi:hypothetical protein
MSSYSDLTISKKNRSLPVAMAGQAAGGISAVLDFLLHFCVNPDVGGIGETNNKINILEPTKTKVEYRIVRPLKMFLKTVFF